MNYHRLDSMRLAFGVFMVIAIVLFSPVVFPQHAHALTISPTRLEIVGDAGKTITEQVLLVNETDDAETFYPSFANFEAQGESGTPTFVEPKEGLGTWMTAGGPVTLKGGESKEVTVTISIPAGTEPGGNFAAIFWATTPPSQTGAVSVGSQVGLLVLLSVSGEVKEDFGLVDFNTKGKQFFYKSLPVGFEYRFSNQGGDRVKPEGTVTVRSIFGWRVAKIDANPYEGNVLPTTTRKFTPEWKKRESVEEKEARGEEKYSFKKALAHEWQNFAVGIFRAQLKTEFGTEEQRATSKNVYFVVFPWELLLVLVPGVYILLRVLKFMLRRYNRSIIKKAARRSGSV